MFAFMRTPKVRADDNAAERARRPLVIRRMISGGARSAQGSATRLDFASAFGTWQAHRQNPFAACVTALH
ncbi:MAG: hypothetical protein NVSMB65_04900 [Chloroflexota bacterium]